jgi:hypothetical protein
MVPIQTPGEPQHQHQSGFQPIDSTVNQLLHIYHTIISNLDVGKDVRFVFCVKTVPIQTPGGPQHLLPPNQTGNPHVLPFVFYLLNSQLSN